MQGKRVRESISEYAELALPNDAESADRVHQALLRLRSDPQVIFAEVALARPEQQ